MGLRTILRIFSILVLMGLVAGLDCKAQEIDKDLALYLNFEEGSGEAVKDQSPNGYLGKAYGGPVWVEGVKGKAMEFDGKDDYLLLKEENTEKNRQQRTRQRGPDMAQVEEFLNHKSNQSERREHSEGSLPNSRLSHYRANIGVIRSDITG